LEEKASRLEDKNGAPPSALTLSLDTTSKRTSIAVTRGQKVLASFGAESDESRSVRLWTEIEFVLGAAGITISDVELYCVCTGPGGFTGLRVGLAAMKGFAAAQCKPMIGITSLEAIAFAAGPSKPVLALANAYKSEVYSQLFGFDAEAVPQPLNDPAVLPADQALERVKELSELIIAGEQTELSTRSQAPGESIREWVIRGAPSFLAEYIARLGAVKYSRGEAVSARQVQACYVRAAEAELKLASGLLGSKIRRTLRAG
jgi:tRNA threonylcarbamoyladenosine biosynthesis protein TsaB